MDRDPAEGPGGRRVEALHPPDYGIGHRALAKILANAEPPGYQMAEIRRKPVLGPHPGHHRADPGRRQRGPAQAAPHGPRIFERLRDEYGYTGCYSQVRRRAAAKRTPRRPSSRSAIRRATPSSTSARPPSRSPACAPRPRWASSRCPIRTRTSSVRLSERVHRDLPGRPRGRLRVLRRRAGADLL
jgi:hypothetical protein